MKKGLFISVEGLDGSGKTTQVQGIKAYFDDKGIEPLMVREPGGTKIGEKIRHILLDNLSLDTTIFQHRSNNTKNFFRVKQLCLIFVAFFEVFFYLLFKIPF